MNYFVLNADIINSREQRFNYKDFKDKISLLNEEFKEDIIVKFSILKGDEIQGLIRNNCDIFKMIRMVKYIFLPYSIRIGVGYGSIYNEEDIKEVNSAWELNGEAFFNARDAIDEMHEGKGKKDIEYNVYFKTKHSVIDNRINIIYTYINDQLNKWKEDVWDIILLLEQSYKHEEIAEEVLKKENHSSDSDFREHIQRERVNITKKIQRSNWYRINQTEKLLNEMLKEGIK